MTDQEINEAIAVQMGWTRGTDDDGWWDSSPSGLPSLGVPSYTTDLNACHEAILTLGDDQLLRLNMELGIICGYGASSNAKHHIVGYWRATARQRADAFLRAIGKWREP